LVTVAGESAGVDLVVTDVIMPQMGGRELLTALRDRNPGLPVLLITGCTDDELLRKGILEPGVKLLRKPFYSADLIAAAGGLLAGGRRAVMTTAGPASLAES
jgi:CheY-like chemotaxis protein